MGKYFAFVISLVLLFYTLFTPIYLLTDSAEDEAAEVTFEELIPGLSHINLTESEFQKKLAILEKLNIDAYKALDDALDDLDDISNISVETVGTRDFRYDRDEIGTYELKQVRILFNRNNNRQYQIDLLVIDKSFFPPGLARVYAILDLKDSVKGSYSIPDQINFFSDIYRQ